VVLKSVTHDLYIAELYRPGSIFALIVWVYLHSLIHTELQISYRVRWYVTVIQSHRNLYSSKRLPISLPLYLYAHLYCFRDITSYLSKFCVFAACFTHPSLV